MDYINYYKILQVDPEAETEVIKAAYRALSRKYHPDGSHPSVERMMRLNDAYAVLSDPPARSRYNDEVERQGFSPGSAAVRPSTMPRMRYQDEGVEPPPPKRRPRYRPYRTSVGLQVIVIAICVLAVLASGLLKPVASTPLPSPTPTPPVYQSSADALQAAYQEDGFVFGQEYTRAGEPLSWGENDAKTASVYIAADAGSIRFASLLLTERSDPGELGEPVPSDPGDTNRALDLLLSASLGPGSDRRQAREWIAARLATPAVEDTVTISGWSIRMWPVSDTQTGIAVLPVAQ